MPEAGFAVGKALLGRAGTGAGSATGTIGVSNCSVDRVFPMGASDCSMDRVFPMGVSDCSVHRVFLEVGISRAFALPGISRNFALPGAETGSDLEPGDVYNFESLGTERGTLNFAAFARFGRLC